MDSLTEMNMNVQGINPTLFSPPAGQNNGPDGMGKDEFLQLLITQLRHQDPLNPMEGTEFATQLAQFNSVEQLINLNEGIGELAHAQNVMGEGLNNSLAATLTGKTVRAMSEQVELGGTGGSDIQFRLRDMASSVEINVLDSGGNVVRSGTLSNLGRGDHTWTWDGKTDAGNRATEGIYRVEISAANGDDNVETLTFTEGQVDKVRFTGNGVELLVGGIRLPLGDIEEIGE